MKKIIVLFVFSLFINIPASTTFAQNLSKNLNFNELVWKEVPNIPWEKRDSQTTFIWDSKLWLLGGLNANETKGINGFPDYEKATYFNDIWNSSDGLNWLNIKKAQAFLHEDQHP